MKKTILTALLLGSIAFTSNAQQTPVLNHYIINPYLSNPSLAGVNGTHIFGIHRSQWVDVKGAPVTSVFTVDGEIPGTNGSLGLLMYRDQVNILGKIGVMGTYAYRLKLNDKQNLRFGISVGTAQNKLLFDQIDNQDIADITLANNVKQVMGFDGNFGINYNINHFNLGISAYQLLSNKLVFLNDQSVSSFALSYIRHYQINASHKFILNQGDWSLQPYIQARTAAKLRPQVDGTLMANYKDWVWAGAGYRTQAGLNFLAGATVMNKLKIGYSYGRSLGAVSNLSTNSHEILMGIKLGTQKNTDVDTDHDGVNDYLDMEPETPHWQHIHGSEQKDASACIVDQRGVTKDSDFDKVPDCVDLEINSIIGAPVDEHGVALDTDNDGVIDLYDREENTPLDCDVDKFGVALDTDHDGVINCLDQQLETPFGAPVDEFGVALDVDQDGVIDFYDLEPNSPAGALVNLRGIAIDSDGDGVLDGVDKQIHSPRGAKVDAYGIAIDSDHDGVPDGLDLEPNSPVGCKVDIFGRCNASSDSPLDSDFDGVPDNLDLEPNTPRGNPVDSRGRSIKQEEANVDGGKINLDDMVNHDSENDYYIIIGVFQNYDNVKRYQKKLFDTYNEPTKLIKSPENTYYVWTIPVYTREEASAEINRLQAKNIEDYIVGNPWVWRAPKNP